MLSEPYDSASAVLLGDSIDASKANIDQLLGAIEKIDKANKKGQFRKFTGNDYTQPLAKGDIWVALAYSGDLVQLQSDNPDLRFAYAEEGCPLFTDNMMMPAKVEHPYAAETMMNYVYDPEVAATIAAYVNYISPVKGVKEVLEKKDPKLANNPLIFPPEDVAKRAAPLPRAVAEGRADDAGGDGEGHGGCLAMLRLSLRRRRQLLPWLFLGPGLLWLIVFFAIPLVNQLNVSLQSGDAETGYSFTWNFSVYTNAISDYSTQFLRSIGYAATATILCLIIGFPLAYFTAFKAGQVQEPDPAADHPAVLRLLRAADGGLAADPVRQRLGRGAPARRRAWSSEDGRLLATRTAVIAGITYNFLPFMVLPLYVSLEKMDRRLIEAATDLYASRTTAFRRVTLPLALPGIFAGSLLTFIPACGDFINAALLGTPRQYMIGNVIQSKFINHPRLPDRGRAVVHPHDLHPGRDLHLRPRCSGPRT